MKSSHKDLIETVIHVCRHVRMAMYDGYVSIYSMHVCMYLCIYVFFFFFF